MPLRRFPPKKVARTFVERFWRSWQSRRGPDRMLVPNSGWNRKVWALSPTTLTTIRRFDNSSETHEYIKNQRALEKEIMKAKPRKFDLRPLQFFAQNNGKILERVYPGVDISQFEMGLTARYSNQLRRRLYRKGIDISNEGELKKIKNELSSAEKELRKIINESPNFFKYYDTMSCNILFLDYDQQTGKFLFAMVDHANPASRRTAPP